MSNYCGRSLRMGEVPLPVLAVRRSALTANIAMLAAYCRENQLLLAPHAKTHLTHEIARLQLAAGAWGLTVASPEQAAVYAAADAAHILIANEVVGPASLRVLRQLHEAEPARRVYCLVDSIRGVELLDHALRGAPTLGVLLEFGYLGRRAGVRDLADAVLLAEAVKAAANLELAGICMYEGAVAGDRSPASLSRVDAALDALARAARELEDSSLFTESQRAIVTAGGSVFFDRVAGQLSGLPRSRYDVVLRSGAYATHDDGHYAELSPLPFTPALEVWADVLSVPQADLAILGAGKRDVPYDMDLPTPKAWVRAGIRYPAPMGWHVLDTHDHHAFLRITGPAPEPGETVILGLSHPCTSFDKWRSVLAVGDDDVVEARWVTHFSLFASTTGGYCLMLNFPLPHSTARSAWCGSGAAAAA